jgi:hypothetical protein
VVPRELKRSDLIAELKHGQARLELALAGLTDEQCGMIGVIPYWSVTDLLSHLVGLELLAFKKISARSSPFSRIWSRTSEAQAQSLADVVRPKEGKSVDVLLSEFRVFRRAIIEWVEWGGKSSAGGEPAYGLVVELSVARFEQHVAQIEAWRDSDAVRMGIHSETDSRELRLNEAILEIAKIEVILRNFDVQALLLGSVGDYYSEEAAFWIGDELIAGKRRSYERLAAIVEPAFMAIKIGMGGAGSLRVVKNSYDLQGQFTTLWEVTLVGSPPVGMTLQWRTTRLWKEGKVIAERVEEFPGLVFAHGTSR